MSDAIQRIRDRIEQGKYSRETGLRAICERAVHYRATNGGPVIKYEWLRKVVDGRIKNPGFDRIDQLTKVLVALDSETGIDESNQSPRAYPPKAKRGGSK